MVELDEIVPEMLNKAQEVLVTEQLTALLLVLQLPTVAVNQLGKCTETKLPDINAFDVVKLNRYWVTTFTFVTVGTTETDVRGPVWQAKGNEPESIP